MEFALSENNERITAKPHIKGFCSVCKTSMIAKCGSIYRHHWAHESKINCDPWWENETDWHRRWKEIVSPDLREVVIKRDGVTHRADVQLPSGIVVEFQKSSLPFGERIKREIFYEKMLWVFYCSREKIGNTEKIFQEGWFDDTLLELKNFNRWIYQPPHQSPMFLDFDDGTIFQVNEIDYREHLNKTTKWLYGTFITKADFVNRYLNKNFSELDTIKLSHNHSDWDNLEQQSREVWAKLHEEERERKREYWAKKNAERNARQAEIEKKQEDDRLKAEAERQAERKEAEEARNNFVWCIKPDETYQDYVKRYQKYLELKKK